MAISTDTSSFWNPKGNDTSSLPSWNDSFNYKPSSSYSSGNRSKALSLASTFKSIGDSFLNKDSNSGSSSTPQFGSATAASSFDGPDQTTKIFSQGGHAPFYIPGVQGDPGPFGSIMGAAGQIGGALIAASDIRVKENINKVGTSSSGTNVYRWNYIGSPQRYQGVIAQEVPWACVDKDGIKYVDYSKVDVDFQEVNA
jgi:hypothetical protein